MSKTYLIAGATGYLGKHLVRAAKGAGHHVRALARKPQAVPNCADEIISAEATDSASLRGVCDGVDVVVSALGITRQRDGLSYDDVDYAANKNILDEALRAGVRRFGYVHVLNAEQLLHVPMVHAKARFAEELERAPIDSTVISPSGFFSDIEEVLAMARSGRVFLFGNGGSEVTPIDGRDMAEVCVAAIEAGADKLDVGGPETWTFQGIAELAFEVLGKPPKVTRIPTGFGTLGVAIAKRIGLGKAVGPLEFFVAASSINMRAPHHGSRRLREHFESLLTGNPKASNENVHLFNGQHTDNGPQTVATS